MLHNYSSFHHRPIMAAFLILFLWVGQPKAIGQSASPSLDIFSGLDFNFRDIDYETQYDLLIRLTPGFKWNMGNHWQLAGQVLIPIVNDYGENYKYVRPNIFNISKEMRFGSLYLKATGGLFTHQRYGIDLKAFLPMCEWFAFEGQAGVVGPIIIIPGWRIGPMNRFTWTAGGDFYLPRWNTQFRGVIGRYLYQDFGCEVEAMRHFNHTTVSLYGRWNNQNGFDSGFRFVIALPPYHRNHRTVNFRPASNFRLSYSVMYHQYTNRMYRTDPEENERDGWFSRDLLKWGSHNMDPDFTIKTKNDSEIKENEETETDNKEKEIESDNIETDKKEEE